MKCTHKHRLNEKDKLLLMQARITVYECHVCEQIAKRAEELRGKPRLRLEKGKDEDTEC
jgi:hypothetical protein